MKNRLFLLALLCTVFSTTRLSAYTVYYYNEGNYNFAVWYWETGSNGTWSDWMTAVPEHDKWFQTTIPDACTNVIFVVFSKDQTTPDWSQILSQTRDLQYDGTNAFYVEGDGWKYNFDMQDPQGVLNNIPIDGLYYNLKENTLTAKVTNNTSYISLTAVSIPDTITYKEKKYAVIGIEYGAFANSNLTAVVLADGVTDFGAYAFYGCTKLSSVTLPADLTYISFGAFCFCSSLSEINIPSTVTSIGTSAFRYSALTSIDIPYGVTTIGNSAFSYCVALTSVIIPSTVTNIEEYAFAACTALDTIYNYATTPQSISADVFYGIDQSACLLIVPEESMPLYKSAPVWKYFLFEDGTLIKPSYSDCELELVGDAIADQEGAFPDPSGWQWGNVYPMGTPVRNGNLYTWQVSQVHITTTGYGFHIRTKNGEPSGEMELDINYYNTGEGTNLTVSEDALYDITFTFNSDTKETTYSCVKHASTPLTDIEENSPRTHTRKLLHNGQIYILHGEKTYSLTGQDIVLK